MTQFLPSNLLALFAPREPLKYLPPVGKLPHEKNLPPYSGLSLFVKNFEKAEDCPPPTRVETKDERKERQKKERAEQVAYKLEQDLALWDPINDPSIRGDPFKTLFVSRINYDTNESKLRREFDAFGPVRRVHLVLNSVTGKPRGYAFVEFEHERDMHAAYKHADGRKIDGRRVLVDVERGRTVKGWRPRRLGGGLGNTRRGGNDLNTKYSGREDSGRERDILEDRRGMEERATFRPSTPDRPRRSSRSRSKDRRSRSKERRRRSRSKERRRRSRERRRSTEREVKKELLDETEIKAEPGMEDNKEALFKHNRRSRSPRSSRRSRSPRDRKRRRSRSRERRSSRERRDRTSRRGGENSAGGSQNGPPQGPFIKEELDNMQEYEDPATAAGGGGYEGNGGNNGYNRLEDM